MQFSAIECESERCIRERVHACACVRVCMCAVGTEVGGKRKRAQSFRRCAAGAYKATHFADHRERAGKSEAYVTLALGVRVRMRVRV